MATYNQLALSGGGALGETLNAAQTYTFTIATPAYTSQSVYFGDAYFILNSSVAGNPLLDVINASAPLAVGRAIPLSNTPISCDVNQIATIYVTGLTQGGGAVLSFQSTGYDGNAGTGKITEAIVTSINGSNFLTGDEIIVPRGVDGIQGLGFTNADKPAEMDIFNNYLENDGRGYAIDANLGGAYNTPTGDVRMQQFATSSNSNNSTFNVGFNIRQDVGFGNGTFNFTPTNTVAASSYTIQSTGHFTLDIT